VHALEPEEVVQERNEQTFVCFIPEDALEDEIGLRIGDTGRMLSKR
jgi:hypothetical protein